MNVDTKQVPVNVNTPSGQSTELPENDILRINVDANETNTEQNKKLKRRIYLNAKKYKNTEYIKCVVRVTIRFNKICSFTLYGNIHEKKPKKENSTTDETTQVDNNKNNVTPKPKEKPECELITGSSEFTYVTTITKEKFAKAYKVFAVKEVRLEFIEDVKISWYFCKNDLCENEQTETFQPNEIKDKTLFELVSK